MKVREVSTPYGAKVIIEGEVDLYSSPEVRTIILNLTKSKTPAIVVDLGQVSYMDSSGVASLVEGLQQAGKYRGHFILANLQNAVRDVFELSRLDKVFDIHETLEEAEKSLKSR